MRRLNTTNLLTIAASTLLSLSSGLALAEAPDRVTVRNISYAGSGCPAGTVSNNVSPDSQAFTLLFDQYTAEAGPRVPFNQKRKNCQISVGLFVPQGWSYSIFTVDTRGYVAVEPGVLATQQSSYYFQGEVKTARLRTQIYGPADRNYQARDQLNINDVVWSACGAARALNINTEVRIDNSQNPNGSGLMTIDSIDGQFKLVYGLQWRRCR